MIQDKFKSSKKMIGIEIGSDTLKLAVCIGDAVAEMAVKRLPENLIREGRVTAPTALTNFIKDMLKEHGLRPGPCAFILPPQVVIAHHVTMPLMSEQELKSSYWFNTPHSNILYSPQSPPNQSYAATNPKSKAQLYIKIKNAKAKKTLNSSMPALAVVALAQKEKTCHKRDRFFGRGRRLRTLGLRFWRPPLYQLSYSPL